MEDDKGYTIRDKRKLFQDGPEREENTENREGQTGAPEGWEKSGLFNELGFSTFILSLSTSALVHLAELPDPVSNEKKVNLQLAKQTIALIEMLKEKTKGNLTGEEGRLIDDLLYDLRLKYVQAAK
jgi:hypothetical protein